MSVLNPIVSVLPCCSFHSALSLGEETTPKIVDREESHLIEQTAVLGAELGTSNTGHQFALGDDSGRPDSRIPQ